MPSLDRTDPVQEATPPAPAPDVTPAPETPDRPHGDPLAPQVPTDPPVQPDEDPTVDAARPVVSA